VIPVTAVRRTKFEILGERLKEAGGALVDVGARDRILQPYLSGSRLCYLSADLGPGHDFNWNLELPIPAPDNAYDFVTALDVLEHVEQFHSAFRELLRITRCTLFVALPNMTHLAHRLEFFVTGRIGAKYALLPKHQGDRHRWLTHYKDIVRFMEHQAATARVSVRQYNWIHGYSPLERLISYLPVPPGLKAYTVLFEILKASHE
jgi:hypothetical protein